jgi:pimeloyl-ACP methyl ester carboxylesterase
MTMPVNPDVEVPNLNLNTSLPTGELPFGYNVAPAGFLDATSQLSGSCSNANNKACLPAWNGTVNEQDARLNPFLRKNAASHDAKLLLGRAVWLALGLNLPGSVQGMNCGGTNADCSKALAELAVTGREAFNMFIGWNPSFAPASSGPQVADLVALVNAGHGDLPVIPASINSTQLTNACTQVLTDAYTALWAIRSNDPTWRQFRMNTGWIAVSGEDDAPHRPVNVFTAPYPQFDIPVPVTVGGRAFTLIARYMVAAGQTLMTPTVSSTPMPPPPVPTITLPSRGGLPCTAALNLCPHRFAIPNDDPTALLNGQLHNKNVIVYIHGGGSRLEEAVPMATQFVTKFGDWSNNLIVISFDLPNSGYDDPMITATDGLGARAALDASSLSFENGSNGGSPSNIYNFPVLNFTINFINNMIRTLDSKGILNAHQVVAVMGGSLGGNTSLLLGMNPIMPPFHLENPLAFSAPASAPGGAQPTLVSWSPTTMVSYWGNASVIIASNMCCMPTQSAGPTWQPEATDTRPKYISGLYFSGTGAGLPPDPEMWYRDDWNDAQGHSAATSFITQSRFDRYEIYSTLTRLWTTSIDTEQAIFSFQTNTDTSGQSYQPMYDFIRARLLLATGACDDYDNGGSTAPFAPPPTISTGTCARHGIGNTGSNALNHQDIYGFTHDVANDMRNATGRTLFLNDTGHSIHDERPVFFAQQIFNFLTMADNNINITLRTGNDDLRWNSEVHAIVTVPFGGHSSAFSTTFDFPLNYWFHPWPAASSSPNNPCGACYKLTAFHMASGANGGTTENNFTIALPWNIPTSSVTSFHLEYIAGTASAGNVTDKWNLSAVAACLPGSTGGFISEGFPPNGTIQSFSPSSANQPITWLPPSFVSPSVSSRANNCSPLPTNPPPNSDVPSTVWNQGFQMQP